MSDDELLAQIAVTLGRPLTDPETAQATLWLGQARGILKAALGDLSTLDQVDLATVLVESVANRLKNPDKSTSKSSQVSVDDGSVQNSTLTRATGAIEIEQWMWDLLIPASARSGAFSVMPYFDADCDAS